MASRWARPAVNVLGPALAVLVLAGCTGHTSVPASGRDPCPRTQEFPAELTNSAPQLFGAPLPNGGLVVGWDAVDASTPSAVRPIVLNSLRADCSPDQGFGSHGRVQLTPPGWQVDSDIRAVAADSKGRLLLVGGTGRSWIVGRLLRSGRPDPAFGTRGWTTIQPPESATVTGPEATAVLSLATGGVVVGGDDGNAHCCVRDWVAALSPAGALDSRFGRDGWVGIADGNLVCVAATPDRVVVLRLRVM